jgi:hypothetical protein
MATNPKRTFNFNKEFKKFGVFGFMDVVRKRQAVLGKIQFNCLGAFQRFFSVQNYFDSSDDIAMFLILKISAVKEYIFLWFYLIINRNVLRNLQRLQTRKIKQNGEKRWLFEEIISHYGILLEL